MICTGFLMKIQLNLAHQDAAAIKTIESLFLLWIKKIEKFHAIQEGLRQFVYFGRVELFSIS